MTTQHILNTQYVPNQAYSYCLNISVFTIFFDYKSINKIFYIEPAKSLRKCNVRERLVQCYRVYTFVIGREMHVDTFTIYDIFLKTLIYYRFK